MRVRIAKVVLPALLALFIPAPASAQIRVELGHLSIRVAPQAPPRPRIEVRPARPGRAHVWIGGYWDRQNDQWAWAPGRWDQPQRRGSSWVRPRYRREGSAWRYDPGHWSHERLVEGDDYRGWREERNRGRGHDRGRGRGRGDDDDRGRRGH
ncbi:MAG: YXWGXW repeat-containing protein [Holophagaceae bacterium]|nr:YXWGXW repeat-containing protein [Holophagaceae bacterium]